MKKRHPALCTEHARTIVLVIAGLIGLAGCSSGLTKVQTWDSSTASPEAVAVLSAPGSIKVREVNSRRMANFLIDDLALDYELVPGANEIVFTYKTIWAKSDAVEDGESKVYVVETPRQRIQLNAQADETYVFDVDKAKSRSEAESFSENFSARLINSDGEVVAQSSPFVASSEQARTPMPGDSPAQSSAVSPADATLDQLKSLWGQASEEEKREFLRWAFE